MKLPIRDRKGHKGTYGKVGIVSGSKGMAGCCYLACQTALRTGSGLVYNIVPESLETILSIKLTEVIIRSVNDNKKGHFVKESIDEIKDRLHNIDVIAIGPGIGVDEERKEVVGEIIKYFDGNIVIDADGLNCLALDKDILKYKKKDIIITPHPGEMARLLKTSVEDVENNRREYAKEFAEEYDVIVALKGNNTVVASPSGDMYINYTGNPGMATAGSGDVLTGTITSLLGQGIEPFTAAKLGVYVHGLSGDISANEKGEYGVIASDILENIPIAIKKSLY